MNKTNRRKGDQNDGSDEAIYSIQSRPFITKNEVVLREIGVHLDDEIGAPSEYRDLITLLFNSNENDIITLYINSPGGQLDSAMAIVEGMKITKSHVRCILLGACHSAASIISMYADEIIILDAAHALVHTASFGSIGNSNNIKTHTDFTVRQIEKFIHETYDGFLSPAELIQVKSGVELWFDADQIRTRIEKRIKYIADKAAQPVKRAPRKTKKVEVV